MMLSTYTVDEIKSVCAKDMTDEQVEELDYAINLCEIMRPVFEEWEPSHKSRKLIKVEELRVQLMTLLDDLQIESGLSYELEKPTTKAVTMLKAVTQLISSFEKTLLLSGFNKTQILKEITPFLKKLARP